MKTTGTLYLIPAPLGETLPDTVIPARALKVLRTLDHFVVEEIRTARRYLRKAGFVGEMEKLVFYAYNEHSRPDDLTSVITSLLAGRDMGLLSEAGLPCVGDPGNELVKEAHRQGIQVVPLTGPSSVMLALMASGFNGQHFTFLGYLPVKAQERMKAIRRIERTMYQQDQTQIFIEAPYRNLALFNDLMKTCAGETYLCIACDLTLETEWIRTRKIKEWVRESPEINKRPAVFLLYK
ncbi:MAG: SAM-dependent methyltransferase [Bacteroidales bacterium]|nr:SAM-dependent methyltransferase [Bacteroidales bacterium]